MKYKIWDKQENLITPTGKIFTPADVFAEYPASQVPGIKYIIADQPINMAVFMEFEQTKNVYKSIGANITDNMSDEEVLLAIQDFEENPPVASPTAEERIASALEFQNLLGMPDEEEVI
jgi:hypothetical protein